MLIRPRYSIKIFPAYLDWSTAVEDISQVPLDETKLRLVSKAKSFDKLPLLKHLKSLWCFNLKPESLNFVCDCSTLEKLFIDGFKSDNLQYFKRLNNLRVLNVGYCSKISSLDELKDFQNLESLAIENFKNVHDISALSQLTKLEELAVMGGMWTRMKIFTLKPLSALHNLKYLNLTSLKVEDESLKPLETLTQLRELVIANYYPMEEFARLSGKLKNTECSWFRPFVEMPFDCRKCQKDSMVMLTGKGKPNLCKDCDAVRLAKHVAAFEKIATTAKLEI